MAIRIFYKNLRMLELEERQRFERGSLIEVINPSTEEIEHLHKKLSVDSSLIHDALDPYEVPRLESSGNDLYVFLRYPIKENGVISTIPLLIIIADKFLMLVTLREFDLIGELNRTLEDIATTQKTKLVLQILSRMHRQYKLYLNDINRQVNSLSIRARGERIDNSDIMSFIGFEDTLNDFISALIPYSSILHRLVDGRNLKLFNDDKDLIEDLILGSEELIQLSKNSLNTSINIRDAYSTVLTNTLNRVIKFLTSLTIILTVAVIIPSIYGMNIDLPFQRSPHAFAIVMCITAGISVFLIWLFNKKKWL
ncbi:MAG: magnesium transporter CorA family protein [Candidatus Paceibacterota bacterium]